MATKSVSSFTLIFILVLVIFEVPEIKAQDSECLKEYGGNVGFNFCAPRIYPSFCGICRWGDSPDSVKCLCEYCSDQISHQILSGGI
ncbi:BnaC04g53020D [Brassica napus]|uniref:BnaC04g53020D protein n=1 Tax=Brassica napus TaxID=3708 RepID=A0A078J5Z6_BRANA|nr:BnaC04g53020D [Brassica napus]